jgi:hypothetical protein
VAVIRDWEIGVRGQKKKTEFRRQESGVRGRGLALRCQGFGVKSYFSEEKNKIACLSEW